MSEFSAQVELYETLADVSLTIRAEQESTGIVAVVDGIEDVFPQIVCLPERRVLIPYGGSLMWQGRPVDEEKFYEFCAMLRENISSKEGAVRERRVIRKAREYVRKMQIGERPSIREQRAYHGVVVSSSLEEARREIECRLSSARGKYVSIANLSFFNCFHRDGSLLFEPRPSYMTIVRPEFMDDLERYLRSFAACSNISANQQAFRNLC